MDKTYKLLTNFLCWIIRDEAAVVGLEKILHVWSDRKVFEESFITELNNILVGGENLFLNSVQARLLLLI